MTRGVLPHSDIPGSKLVCSSPGLFAACHVLHRLLAPRHSPYTLSSLTIKLKTDAHQSFACRLVCDSFFRNTACVCGRKKLPCAEYSVVKDQRCRASAGNLLTSGGVWRATEAALNKPSPDVGVRETQEPHSLTETFSAVALRASARQARTCAVVSNICSPHRPACLADVRLARGWPAWPKPRSMPRRGEGWWRIPGSNR